MSKEKNEPVLAICAWKIIPVVEHGAIVFKFDYTEPPHGSTSKTKTTPAFSLPAEQLNQLAIALQQSLAVLQGGDENTTLPTQKDLH